MPRTILRSMGRPRHYNVRPRYRHTVWTRSDGREVCQFCDTDSPCGRYVARGKRCTRQANHKGDCIHCQPGAHLRSWRHNYTEAT